MKSHAQKAAAKREAALEAQLAEAIARAEKAERERDALAAQLAEVRQ